MKYPIIMEYLIKSLRYLLRMLILMAILVLILKLCGVFQMPSVGVIVAFGVLLVGWSAVYPSIKK